MIAGSGADPVTIVFGSLGGVAAVVVAVNTVQLRREARRDNKAEREGKERMDTFEISQTSLERALARADLENERLNTTIGTMQSNFDKAIQGWQRKVEEQEDEIMGLNRKVSDLEIRLEELLHGR